MRDRARRRRRPRSARRSPRGARAGPRRARSRGRRRLLARGFDEGVDDVRRRRDVGIAAAEIDQRLARLGRAAATCASSDVKYCSGSRSIRLGRGRITRCYAPGSRGSPIWATSRDGMRATLDAGCFLQPISRRLCVTLRLAQPGLTPGPGGTAGQLVPSFSCNYASFALPRLPRSPAPPVRPRRPTPCPRGRAALTSPSAPSATRRPPSRAAPS